MSWTPPATVAEVPWIRRIGMSFSQTEGWLEAVCTCDEPCNSVYCPNLVDLPHRPPRCESMPDSA